MQAFSSLILIAVGFYLVSLNLAQWQKLESLVSETALLWQGEFDLRICASLAATEANLLSAQEMIPVNEAKLRDRLRSLAQTQRDRLFKRYPEAPKPDHQGRCRGTELINLATSLHREDKDAAFSQANWVSRFTTFRSNK
jgi:hypothetical protein